MPFLHLPPPVKMVSIFISELATRQNTPNCFGRATKIALQNRLDRFRTTYTVRIHSVFVEIVQCV